MQSLQSIFQIRQKCIIEYIDYSPLNIQRQSNNQNQKEYKREPFSTQAKKRMNKYIQLFEYTINEQKKKISFITLTLSSKKTTDEKIETYLKTWLEKIQYRYGKVNYIWKLELQENGNPHYHILIDKEIDWKIIRGIWNKTQKTEVDNYQTKMKNKYKNGYYYDTEMKNKNNETIDEEIQYKRYLKGKKANWRNPNSTDNKIINTEIDNIGTYINKYITKKETEKLETHEETIKQLKLKRFWACNDEIKLLKYATITETQLNAETIKQIQQLTIKEIKNEQQKTLCTIIKRLENNSTIVEIENKQKLENIKNITYNDQTNTKLIEKETKKYNQLFD
tara:strand:+ start:19 stop:1026 length:1008 start_codon:yes stop_codon:yes gene_type:complete